MDDITLDKRLKIIDEKVISGQITQRMKNIEEAIKNAIFNTTRDIRSTDKDGRNPVPITPKLLKDIKDKINNIKEALDKSYIERDNHSEGTDVMCKYYILVNDYYIQLYNYSIETKNNIIFPESKTMMLINTNCKKKDIFKKTYAKLNVNESLKKERSIESLKQDAIDLNIAFSENAQIEDNDKKLLSSYYDTVNTTLGELTTDELLNVDINSFGINTDILNEKQLYIKIFASAYIQKIINIVKLVQTKMNPSQIKEIKEREEEDLKEVKKNIDEVEVLGINVESLRKEEEDLKEEYKLMYERITPTITNQNPPSTKNTVEKPTEKGTIGKLQTENTKLQENILKEKTLRENVVRIMKETIKGKEETIEEKDKEIVKLKEENENLTKKIEENTRKIIELEKGFAVETNPAYIKCLEDKKELEEKNAKCDAALKEATETIKKLKGDLVEMQEELREEEGKIKNQAEIIKEKEKEMKELENEIESVKNRNISMEQNFKKAIDEASFQNNNLTEQNNILEEEKLQLEQNGNATNNALISELNERLKKSEEDKKTIEAVEKAKCEEEKAELKAEEEEKIQKITAEADGKINTLLIENEKRLLELAKLEGQKNIIPVEDQTLITKFTEQIEELKAQNIQETQTLNEEREKEKTLKEKCEEEREKFKKKEEECEKERKRIQELKEEEERKKIKCENERKELQTQLDAITSEKKRLEESIKLMKKEVEDSKKKVADEEKDEEVFLEAHASVSELNEKTAKLEELQHALKECQENEKILKKKHEDKERENLLTEQQLTLKIDAYKQTVAGYEEKNNELEQEIDRLKNPLNRQAGYTQPSNGKNLLIYKNLHKDKHFVSPNPAFPNVHHYKIPDNPEDKETTRHIIYEDPEKISIYEPLFIHDDGIHYLTVQTGNTFKQNYDKLDKTTVFSVCHLTPFSGFSSQGTMFTPFKKQLALKPSTHLTLEENENELFFDHAFPLVFGTPSDAFQEQWAYALRKPTPMKEKREENIIDVDNNVIDIIDDDSLTNEQKLQSKAIVDFESLGVNTFANHNYMFSPTLAYAIYCGVLRNFNYQSSKPSEYIIRLHFETQPNALNMKRRDGTVGLDRPRTLSPNPLKITPEFLSKTSYTAEEAESIRNFSIYMHDWYINFVTFGRGNQTY